MYLRMNEIDLPPHHQMVKITFDRPTTMCTKWRQCERMLAKFRSYSNTGCTELKDAEGERIDPECTYRNTMEQERLELTNPPLP